MSENLEKLRSYRAMFIIDPDKEDTINDVKENIKTILIENSGKVTEEKDLGKKELGTPMKKKKQGFYYQVYFSALPSSLTKINRLCNINLDIMRSIVDYLGTQAHESPAPEQN